MIPNWMQHNCYPLFLLFSLDLKYYVAIYAMHPSTSILAFIANPSMSSPLFTLMLITLNTRQSWVHWTLLAHLLLYLESAFSTRNPSIPTQHTPPSEDSNHTLSMARSWSEQVPFSVLPCTWVLDQVKSTLRPSQLHQPPSSHASSPRHTLFLQFADNMVPCCIISSQTLWIPNPWSVHMDVVHICTLLVPLSMWPVIHRWLVTLCVDRTHKHCTARHTVLCEAEPQHLEPDNQMLIVVCRQHWGSAFAHSQHIVSHWNSTVLVETCRWASIFCSG